MHMLVRKTINDQKEIIMLRMKITRKFKKMLLIENVEKEQENVQNENAEIKQEHKCLKRTRKC